MVISSMVSSMVFFMVFYTVFSMVFYMVFSMVFYMVFSMVFYMVCSVVRSRSVSVITIAGFSILHIHSTCSSLSISGPLAMVRYFISSMAMVVMAVVGMLRHNSSVTVIAVVVAKLGSNNSEEGDGESNQKFHVDGNCSVLDSPC